MSNKAEPQPSELFENQANITRNGGETSKQETNNIKIGKMASSNLITGIVNGNVHSQGDVYQAEGQVTAKQVTELLTELERRIQSLEGLPESEKEKSIRRLGAAKAEAEEEEPNKDSIATQLKRVNETLTHAGETSQGIKEFIKEVAPTVVKIAGWLGYALGSIWGVM